MSCYFRYMKDILSDLNPEITKQNKKEIDALIHNLVDTEYKNCSATWAAIKTHIKADEETKQLFVDRLKKSLDSI